MKKVISLLLPLLLTAATLAAEPARPPVQILLNGDPAKGLSASRTKPVAISAKQITRFNVVPGLINKDLVSLEPVNTIGYFLRHQSFVLYLQRRDKRDNLFSADASFRIVNVGDKVRFQASNFPNHFLTVRDDGTLILTRTPRLINRPFS